MIKGKEIINKKRNNVHTELSNYARLNKTLTFFLDLTSNGVEELSALWNAPRHTIGVVAVLQGLALVARG